MKRRINALGIVLSVMAMSVAMVSAAQAEVTIGDHHTFLNGSQVGNGVFTSGEGFGGISCATATLAGTATGTAASNMTLTPTFANCKDSFGRTVDVDNSGLTYQFTTDGTVHTTGSMTTTVTSGGSTVCTIVIKSGQTNDGIGVHNLGGTNGLTVTEGITNLISTTSGGFFNCGVANGEHKNGVCEWHYTLTATNTVGAPVALNFHGPTEP